MQNGSLSLDAFLSRRGADRRLARLTHDIALPEGRGLEFGPGDNPTALPAGMQVVYIDHAIPAGTAAIDHAWAGSGSLSEALGRGEADPGYDFAIAAQVAQYVPNLLGWLRGIHAVLRVGGVLNLSLPDKRFMFDAGRPLSTMAELVEADLLAYERPSPRQLFAHTYEARALDPEQVWAGQDPLRAPRLCGESALAFAHAQTREVLASGAYLPCHCWVFTPAALLDRLEEASRLGLFPFVLNQIGGIEPGGFEFFVSMRRDAETDPDALRGTQMAAIDHLRDALERRRLTAALLGG